MGWIRWSSIGASLLLCGIVGAGPVTTPSSSPSPYPLDSPLEGPQSWYTPLLRNLAMNWKYRASNYPSPDQEDLKVECIETPGEGNRYYIGVEQAMTIRAPIEAVDAILADMGHYKDLFPDLDEMRVIDRDANKLLTFWEQHVPVFFIPNVKYEMTYLIDRSAAKRKIYLYKLKKESKIKLSDGLIVLDAAADGNTHYAEYDFWDADWGPLKTFAPGRIWKDSVEGVYLSDLVVKLKAEHPDWAYRRIGDEARKILTRHPVEPLLARRKRF